MRCAVLLFLLTIRALGQQAETENVLQPSWETQKQARSYFLQIPAPRGQITDRHGIPLAQTRVSYNLAMNFPTPANLTGRGV
ncbi:MAG: penicillin-binding protein 2, partial [Chthoniobacter sp.]|nr:penicillin-binding protein 2 [Chthoniobacter sp.]